MRQSEGSVVCTGCGRLVDVNDKNCPNCGQWRPGMFGFAGSLRTIVGDLDVTQLIVYGCGFLYLLSLVADVRGVMQAPFSLFNLFPPSSRALYLLGWTSGDRALYTVLSATFLHGSLLHIYFNMMWTRNLGPLIEEVFGPARFFIIFVLSGVAGFVVSNQLSGAPTVGASGAVFGLLSAAIIYGRRRGGTFGDSVQRQSWGYAVALLVMGFLLPGVNNWAHLGGFGAGFLLSNYFVRRTDTPETPVEQLAAAALALATVGAVVASVLTSFSYVYELR